MHAWITTFHSNTEKQRFYQKPQHHHSEKALNSVQKKNQKNNREMFALWLYMLSWDMIMEYAFFNYIHIDKWSIVFLSVNVGWIPEWILIFWLHKFGGSCMHSYFSWSGSSNALLCDALLLTWKDNSQKKKTEQYAARVFLQTMVVRAKTSSC